MALLYSVYGLTLGANQRIPGLVALPADERADVQVWLDSLPIHVRQRAQAEQEWYVSPDRDEHGAPILSVWTLIDGAYFRLLYADGTQFLVDRSGTQIWATWPETSTLEDTATYLLGPVLGFVLRLRGVTCLHASAVAVGDKAIALLGPAGAGKSMMAAAFGWQSASVLSDDVVAVVDAHDTFLVEPGYPCLRLRPETVRILYGSASALPLMTPTWDRRYIDLTQPEYRFQRHRLPLAAIYILGERRDEPATPSVESISIRAGLMALVANTYTTYLLDRAMRAGEFELLGRLVARVPVRRVTPHADPAYLPQLREVILDDVRALRPLAAAVPGTESVQYVEHV